MKIRNHKKRKWWFCPHENSTLKPKYGVWFIFKYKSDLMNFLKSNYKDTINGVVRLEEETFNSSYCLKEWTVWYNQREYKNGSKFKIVLKLNKFRNRNFVFRTHNLSKEEEEKILSLMWSYINGHISNGIDFSYWSDRCRDLRMKTIIEYFKQQNLITSYEKI